MAGGEPNNGGRVSTREFYDALLNVKDEITTNDKRQSDERADMERRILGELKCLKDVPGQVKTNTKEIDTLRKNSNIKDWTIGIGAAVGTAISIAIGWDK